MSFNAYKRIETIAHLAFEFDLFREDGWTAQGHQ